MLCLGNCWERQKQLLGWQPLALSEPFKATTGLCPSLGHFLTVALIVLLLLEPKLGLCGVLASLIARFQV